VALLVYYKDEQRLSANIEPLYYSQDKASYMQTQVEVITSENVARKVVTDLKLAQNRELREAFERKAGGKGPIEDWLAADLLSRLKVDTSQSSVIHAAVTSADPVFAARAANAFAKAYIDTVLEIRVEPTRKAAIWFDEQLKSLQANLEAAQARLADYQKENGIVSTDEGLDVETARLRELSIQVARAHEQTLDWSTREQQARGFLEHGASPDRIPEVLSNPFVQSLKTDLTRAEARLQDLATQYGVNYPQYQRQLSENRILREKLDSEMRKIVGGMENSTRQSQRREAELSAAMAAQRAHMLESRRDRSELTVLMRNVEAAQRTYEAAMQRSAVSNIESRARQTNVAVLTPAVEPRNPFRPRVAFNIALAAVVGMMLGVGIVVLMEMLDRRVRSRSDLVIEANVPLLAVLNTWEPAGQHQLGWSGDAGRSLPKPD